jgi:small ubiquitin-related modifier
MSAEEEDKKEDKGDHINLKVKDQVRAATRPAQIVQKTRSRSTRHFENIAETSPRPPFRRTTRRFTSRSGRPRSLRRYVTRQIRPSGPRGRSTPLPPRGYPPSSRLFFLIPAYFRALTPRPPSSSQIFTAFCSRKSLQPGAVRFLFDGQRINPTQTPQEVSRARVPSKTKTMHPMGGAHISVRALPSFERQS